MGAAKEMWMDAVERTEDDYVSGLIDEAEYRAQMRRLGFDQHEIDESISALSEDREASA